MGALFTQAQPAARMFACAADGQCKITPAVRTTPSRPMLDELHAGIPFGCLKRCQIVCHDLLVCCSYLLSFLLLPLAMAGT